MNQPDTFTDFNSAMKVADSYDGIGIRVGAEIIAIDLDHCKDGDTLQPRAAEIVSHFQDTYIEVSPSGTGLRIILFVAKATSTTRIPTTSRRVTWRSMWPVLQIASSPSQVMCS